MRQQPAILSIKAGTIYVGFRIESEAIWEDEWEYNVSIASDHPEHHAMDWVLAFHKYESALRFTTKYSGIFILNQAT